MSNLSGLTLAFGISVYVIGASSLALPASTFAAGMPEVLSIFLFILGLLVSIVAAYAKGISDRVTDNKREIDVLRQALNLTQVSIATEHHTKDEINGQFAKIEAGLNALHRRLDYMRAPSGLGPDHG